MKQRMDYLKAAPGVYKSLLGMHTYLHQQSGLDHQLLELLYLRVSQINGCAFCIDMHWKGLRAAGMPEWRLYMLNAWRESPGYTERERAALEWAEAVTKLEGQQVGDDVYRIARDQFTEPELANLTLAIVAINGWNRLNIAFQKAPALDVTASEPAAA